MLDRVSPKVANHGHMRENITHRTSGRRCPLGLSLGYGWGAVASSHEPAVELHFILGIICRDAYVYFCSSEHSVATNLVDPAGAYSIYRSTGHWLAARLLLLFCDCCDQRSPMVSG